MLLPSPVLGTNASGFCTEYSSIIHKARNIAGDEGRRLTRLDKMTGLVYWKTLASAIENLTKFVKPDNVKLITVRLSTLTNFC